MVFGALSIEYLPRFLLFLQILTFSNQFSYYDLIKIHCLSFSICFLLQHDSEKKKKKDGAEEDGSDDEDEHEENQEEDEEQDREEDVEDLIESNWNIMQYLPQTASCQKYFLMIISGNITAYVMHVHLNFPSLCNFNCCLGEHKCLCTL